MEDLKQKEEAIRQKIAEAEKNAPKKPVCEHSFPEHPHKGQKCFCIKETRCTKCGVWGEPNSAKPTHSI